METNRLEAFSDGVFAVAITLLVFNIKAPPGGPDLATQLFLLWPMYVAYGASGLVIGTIWINHHKMFQHIARTDGTLLLLNTLFLMLVAFLPFPTSVLAEAFHRAAGERVAAVFYGGTLTLIGLLVNVMWAYAARRNRLLDDNLTTDQARRMSRRFYAGPLGYFVATCVALLVPWLALLVFFFLNLFYLWPRRSRADSAAGSVDENPLPISTPQTRNK